MVGMDFDVHAHARDVNLDNPGWSHCVNLMNLAQRGLLFSSTRPSCQGHWKPQRQCRNDGVEKWRMHRPGRRILKHRLRKSSSRIMFSSLTRAVALAALLLCNVHSTACMTHTGPCCQRPLPLLLPRLRTPAWSCASLRREGALYVNLVSTHCIS